MKSYPIWMDITSCIYKSSKSYGIKNDGRIDIRVGTSAKNSHLFGTLQITHRDTKENGKSFRLSLDGTVIKKGTVKSCQLTFTHDTPVTEVIHDLLIALKLARRNGDNALTHETKQVLDNAIAKASGSLSVK